MDKDLKVLRNSRWAKAFLMMQWPREQVDAVDRKATHCD
jgi:hypothetical protein